MDDIPEVTDLLDTQDGAPVIRMINALLTQAARDEASDIHIEPFETHSVVRYRVDGALRDVVAPRAARGAGVADQDHGAAGYRRETPAPGRPHRLAGSRAADRHSRLHRAHRPANGGDAPARQAGRAPEAGDPGHGPGRAGAAGQPDPPAARHRAVTGPTGSGKTTTLYAALARLDASTSNILTVEDPVEYDLPGISQIQVNARIDMTFAVALRAILRQDPDIIMIGEIRDLETAQIAVQASLTGHLVLATLHTNDAVSAVTRLVDMGVEPFLLARRCLAYSPSAWCGACARIAGSKRTAARGWLPCLQPDRLQWAHRHPRAVRDRRRDPPPGPPGPRRAGSPRSRPRRRHAQHARDGERWIASGSTTLEEILRVTRDA